MSALFNSVWCMVSHKTGAIIKRFEGNEVQATDAAILYAAEHNIQTRWYMKHVEIKKGNASN